MRFDLDGLPVHFPYAAIYPEQHAYMGELKHALDVRGHALLEMPMGTGKTAVLISLITSYALTNPAHLLHLIYCTRTVHEMVKTLAELCLLFARLPSLASRSLLALGLSSYKNLYIHP
ncbi:general transcription and DNA repair factor IIH helicase subunit XPD-like [Miscanthus floridulus]|uniref:general transcription and DNA repair factor IIH helicase subunit XPD-like n=1 Tax=Miscanthus floridulus TaxID=154761 RepID=UPI0034573FD5